MTLARALIIATVGAGCIHRLPPVATPGPIATPTLSDPIPPGQGRVFVDVVNGSADVSVVNLIEVDEQVVDQVIETEQTEVLSTCRSPCVLDLPLGPHLLAFPMRGTGGVEIAHVIAAPNPTVYRRALGLRRSGGAGFALGVLGVSFGGASFITGATLLPIGLATDNHGMTLAGEITAGAGAILTAVGIWAIMNSPLTEQAGAGAQY